MKYNLWPLVAPLWIASIGFVGFGSALAAPPGEAPAPLTGLIVASDSTDENAPANIYVTKPDGTVLRYLTQDDNWNRNAGWSYDGTQVVWNVRNSTGGIWVMNAYGEQKQELTARAGGAPSYAFGPAFSPDGKHIAYSDYALGSPGTNPLVGIEVYVMNANGKTAID
jgi:Tol biopolymer transport system component